MAVKSVPVIVKVFAGDVDPTQTSPKSAKVVAVITGPPAVVPFPDTAIETADVTPPPFIVILPEAAPAAGWPASLNLIAIEKLNLNQQPQNQNRQD